MQRDDSAALLKIPGFIRTKDVTVILAGGTAAIDYGKATPPEITGLFEPEITGVARA